MSETQKKKRGLKYPGGKGAKAERRSMKHLDECGFNSMRSAGSQGLFDVVGWNPIQSRFIQVKAGDEVVSPAEREQMQLAVVPANATKEIWRWPSLGKNAKPIIEVL